MQMVKIFLKLKYVCSFSSVFSAVMLLGEEGGGVSDARVASLWQVCIQKATNNKDKLKQSTTLSAALECLL